MHGMNPGSTRRKHVNRTPTHTACTDAQNVSARDIAQSDHFSSREHAWLKFKDLCVPKTFCHPRVMSRGKGGIELSHGPGHAVPGNARGLVVG